MSNYRNNFDGYAFNQDNFTPSNDKYNPDEEARGLVTKSNRNLLRELLFILPLIFFLLILFFSATLLVVNHQGKHSGRAEAHSVLQYLSKNIKLAPIEDLTVVADGDKCADGFTKEVLGNYPGTNAGCVCKDGSVHTKSHCWFKSASECKYSAGTQGHQYDVWATKTFCVKRFGAWKVISAASECPSTMKVCHAQICVSGTNCPISAITFVKSTASAPGTGTGTGTGTTGTGTTGTGTTGTGGTFFVGTSISFNTTHTITIDRETTKLPIVSLSADISKFPCAAASKHRPSTKSTKFYPLEKIQSHGCGQYSSLESMSKAIDTYTQKKFYSENKVDTTVSTLPFFTDLTSDADDAELITIDRANIKATKECQEIEADKVTQLGSEVKRISQVYKIIGILLVIASGIGICLALLFLVLRQKITFLNGRGGYVVLLIVLAICVILATVMFAMHTHQKNSNEFNSIQTHFTNLDKNDCLKEESFKRASQEVAKSASTSHSKLDWIIQVLFWSSVAAVAIILISVILRKVKKLSLLPDPRI